MNSNVVVEFLALNKPVLPAERIFRGALEEFGFDRALIEDYKADTTMISFLYANGVCVLKLIDSPMCLEKLGRCATHETGNDQMKASEKLKRHSSHVIVTWFSRTAPVLEKYVMLTRLMAALASVTDAAGIYWGAGSLVHTTEMFISESRNMQDDHYPIPLWIDFRIEKDTTGGYLLRTNGLEAFGKREISVQRPQKNAVETYNIAFNLARSILSDGLGMHN